MANASNCFEHLRVTVVKTSCHVDSPSLWVTAVRFLMSCGEFSSGYNWLSLATYPLYRHKLILKQWQLCWMVHNILLVWDGVSWLEFVNSYGSFRNSYFFAVLFFSFLIYNLYFFGVLFCFILSLLGLWKSSATLNEIFVTKVERIINKPMREFSQQIVLMRQLHNRGISQTSWGVWYYHFL